MTSDELIAAIRDGALSADSIKDIAYMLTERDGGTSDAVARVYGRWMHAGRIIAEDAEYVVAHLDDVPIRVVEEVQLHKPQ